MLTSFPRPVAAALGDEYRLAQRCGDRAWLVAAQVRIEQ